MAGWLGGSEPQNNKKRKEHECGMIIRDRLNEIQEHKWHQQHHTLLQAKRNKGKENAAMSRLFGIGGNVDGRPSSLTPPPPGYRGGSAKIPGMLI